MERGIFSWYKIEKNEQEKRVREGDARNKKEVTSEQTRLAVSRDSLKRGLDGPSLLRRNALLLLQAYTLTYIRRNPVSNRETESH